MYGTDVDELPVEFTGCENVTCKLCGCKCTDITPLTSLAEVGKTTRWAQYGKVRDPTSGSVVAKKPKGRVDIVWTEKRKETIQTREETVEDDGQGAFSDVRQEAKKASISKGMQQFEKERQELHVVKERLNVEDLLGLVGQCEEPTSAGSAAGAVGSKEDADDVASISSD